MSNEELVLLYQQGNIKALESLIEANEGIVKKLANKFNGINKMIEFDDLVQAGIIGLINAANKYNNELENKASFITYAFQYIKREIFSCVNGRSEKEISNNKLYNSCVSLDVPIQEDNDIQLKDTIESIDYGFENVEEKIYIKQLREELEDAMLDNNTLKEREILQLCYGWNYQKIFTYKEVAETLNISINSIPQIEFNALRKLRNSTWGKEKVKEYMRDKVESIMESSRYNQDKVIDKINLIDKYFSGVI
ncbi:sigma-70 family RNA polymerase sigma factor [Clostridium beijerinckii]|jgi:RNA polymerase sigma factor, sigma-70 family|uniref:RNA polymerase sigma factor n=2 Tax=Clostridium beijerinckii TaxID=1520 RepID=A0AAE2V024_CLOBE|nr:sigma-70 family RNA polymerase sigma factor [Clostridium beijerinckii]ABR37096.1 RNA polymerase, sigma 32 subunit, RpoH [Clostridium beijerinckii NCIMB 8052]AIU04639.1 RNA polymerase, sigma 32 subunit, RpoH [Clostridium beijerinckii ATCC 35702]MBF7808253.1 sigma-70 family RNA polymerase sigma factor [Clostridium beijerinckii]NRT21821.1 RNA polymerase sigma factor (sigma-70 family) [Clostridium beijerinckii]NRT65673.1 RNA polymerase sigma factor (sigma-70 family) [Clostridium beijerinckii]